MAWVDQEPVTMVICVRACQWQPPSLPRILDLQLGRWLLQSVEATVTKSHRQVAYKQQRLVSHCFGGWNSKIKVAAQSGSGEGPLLGGRLLTSHCILTWQKEIKLTLWPLLIRTLLLFRRVPSSRPNYLQRPHIQLPLQWGLGLQHGNFGGGYTRFQSITMVFPKRRVVLFWADSCIFSLLKTLPTCIQTSVVKVYWQLICP